MKAQGMNYIIVVDVVREGYIKVKKSILSNKLLCRLPLNRIVENIVEQEG